jgi:uncharacterized protein (DUF433 family)
MRRKWWACAGEYHSKIQIMGRRFIHPTQIHKEKTMTRITIDPQICHGKPCIRGLRYPVEMLLELLSAGMTTEEILEDYPDLERDDILAALAFAAKLAQVKTIYRLAA